MNERCPQSDLLVDQCAHCRVKSTLKPEFAAQFDGMCRTCGVRFYAGYQIRETATGEYEHARHARPDNSHHITG